MDILKPLRILAGKRLSQRKIQESIDGTEREFYMWQNVFADFVNLFRKDDKIIRQSVFYRYYSRLEDNRFNYGYRPRQYTLERFNLEGLLEEQQVTTYVDKNQQKVQVYTYTPPGSFFGKLKD